jgi:hypothetical protein
MSVSIGDRLTKLEARAAPAAAGVVIALGDADLAAKLAERARKGLPPLANVIVYEFEAEPAIPCSPPHATSLH